MLGDKSKSSVVRIFNQSVNPTQSCQFV